MSQALHSFWSFSNCPPFSLSRILDTSQPGGLISLCHTIFAFSYCSWGSCGKNTGVACHYFLQWTKFCQNSSLWPIHLWWPCIAWLIFSLSYTSPSPWLGCDLWTSITVFIYLILLCMLQWYRIYLPMQEMQETQVWFLGQEDPLEKEMWTHSSILSWEILWSPCDL